MLLVIHNLPSHTKYADVKNLIQKHCGLTNIIVDEFKMEGPKKKVTIGVADDVDSLLIIRKLNGLMYDGNKLRVEGMRKNNDNSHNNNKNSRQNQSNSSSDIPSLLGQNSLNLGQNPSMLNQNNPMNQNIIWDVNNPMGQNMLNYSMLGQNFTMMGQNTSMMGQNHPIMGQNHPMMGQNHPMMGQNHPMMGQNHPMMGQNHPMMGQNHTMMGQNHSMMGQNHPMMGQNHPIMGHNHPMMGQNHPMMGPDSSVVGQNSSLKGQKSSTVSHNSFERGQNSSRMGQNSPSLDPNPPMMGTNYSMMGLNPLIMGQNKTMQKGQIEPLTDQNTPAMAPSPLMDCATSIPFSGPFYMSPQTNDYRNYSRGQQSADRQDNPPSNKYGSSERESRRDGEHKSVHVWHSDQFDVYDRNYSSNGKERYESKRTPSVHRVKRDTEGVFQSVSTRDTSKHVTPWATDPPYTRSAEYGLFDRSYDRGQDRYSDRPDDSGTKYQRQPVQGTRSGSNHRGGSPSAPRKGSSRYLLRSRAEHSPSPKRFKAEPSKSRAQPALPFVNPHKQKKSKMSVQKISDRDAARRMQAASDIVKDMYKKLKIDSNAPHHAVFQKMKTAVRSRLMIIANNRLDLSIPELMVLYKRRFKPDEEQCLYNRIVNHIFHDLERSSVKSKAEAKPSTATPPPTVRKEKPSTVVQPAPAPAPVEQVLDKLPKYPKGDKAAYKLQKQQFKKELKLDSVPELDDATKKALDKEMEAIKEIILAESVNPTHEGEVYFCKGIAEPGVTNELRKMLELNVAKRLLNLGTVPLVRILGVPKLPKKAALEEFLKTRGVVSLKKSAMKAMFIANCDSYESFDKLCALKDVVIDNVKVLFKPMYLTAPLEKVKRKKNQQKGNVQPTVPCIDEPIVMESEPPMQNIEQDFSADITIPDTKTAIPDTKIKHEPVTSVESNTTEEVKTHDVTRFKAEAVNTTTNAVVSTEVKHVVQNESNNIASNVNEAPETETPQIEESAQNKEKTESENDTTADDSDDVIIIENDYAKYIIDDSMEVNEDDLEDY